MHFLKSIRITKTRLARSQESTVNFNYSPFHINQNTTSTKYQEIVCKEPSFKGLPKNVCSIQCQDISRKKKGLTCSAEPALGIQFHWLYGLEIQLQN